MKERYAVDLFCGCGGVSEGLKQAGFSVVAAVDNSPICSKTYQMNHPEVSFFQENIEKLSPLRIKKLLGAKELDLLVVCAPCQPFSSLNKSEKIDPREVLILQSIRYAKRLKPKHIFFENVPGLAKKSLILDSLRQGLNDIGYALSNPISIDAADYEVPQRRVRCIMLASKTGKIYNVPNAITPKGNRITVRDTIAELPEAPLKKNQKDYLHFSRKHTDITIKRLQHISHDGGSRSELPDDLVMECHKGLRKETIGSYSDVLGRMKWDDVSPTLTTGCTDVTKGRYAHPVYDRAITLREAALLQTFPRSYVFCGNPSQIAMQIGNAVPVKLVKNHIKDLEG